MRCVSGKFVSHGAFIREPLLITKAGGRGILSHRLSEYVLNGSAAFADLGGSHRTAGVQVAQLAFDVSLQA